MQGGIYHWYFKEVSTMLKMLNLVQETKEREKEKRNVTHSNKITPTQIIFIFIFVCIFTAHINLYFSYSIINSYILLCTSFLKCL